MAQVPPNEQMRFAKALFEAIWVKFGLVKHDPEAPGCSSDTVCNEGVFRAVVCEQLLIRDFLSSLFFRYRSPVLLENTDSVLAYCNQMCQATMSTWSFFKRFLRCCALVAEFFLYRFSQNMDLQLHTAPAIWCTIFNEHFADHFCDEKEWKELDTYSELYSDQLYDPLDEAISRMQVPYEAVPPVCMMNLPILDCPVTDAQLVYQEMYAALGCIDMHRMFQSPKRSTSARNGKPAGQSSPSRSPSRSPQQDVQCYTIDLHSAFHKYRHMRLVAPIPDDPEETSPTPEVSPSATFAVSADSNETTNPSVVDVENPVVILENLNLENPEDTVSSLENPEDTVSSLESLEDRVVNLENPAGPDEEQVSMNPDVDETSTLKSPENESVVEDVQSQPPESLDSKSRKRVLETSDDVKSPSPKLKKANSSG